MEFVEMNSFNPSLINQTKTWDKNIETLSNIEVFHDELCYANHNFVVIDLSSDEEDIENLPLTTIPKQYFSSIEKVVSEYLMPAMIFLVCKQMQECFYYDCFKVDITTMDFMVQVIKALWNSNSNSDILLYPNELLTKGRCEGHNQAVRPVLIVNLRSHS